MVYQLTTLPFEQSFVYYGKQEKNVSKSVSARSRTRYIKYVPNECIRFPCYGQRYCQITAIDEYSRKRVLKIVKEKSSCETGKFLQSPEKKMGFKISIIRADNGTEFVNDEDQYNRTAKTSLDFKSPDRVVGEYFSKCNNVLTFKINVDFNQSIHIYFICVFCYN